MLIGQKIERKEWFFKVKRTLYIAVLDTGWGQALSVS